jgi:DNA polymerase III epsilon subunit-like protein
MHGIYTRYRYLTNMTHPYIVSIDLETTGLSREDHLTQVAVAIRKGRYGETSTFKSYIFTDRAMHDKVIELTKITPEMLLTAPSLDCVLQQVKEFIDTTCTEEGASRVLVAYNGIAFDIPMLAIAMRRIWDKQKTVDWWRSIRFSYLFDPLLYIRTSYADDTRWSRRTNGNASLKLGDVHFSICQHRIVGAHDALNDCTAVLRVLEDPIFTSFETAVQNNVLDDKHTKNVCRFIDQMLVCTTNRKQKKNGRSIVEMLQPKKQCVSREVSAKQTSN